MRLMSSAALRSATHDNDSVELWPRNDKYTTQTTRLGPKTDTNLYNNEIIDPKISR